MAGMTAATKRSTDTSALTPFELSDIARLRRYAQKAHELRDSQFMREPQEFRPSTDEYGFVTYEISNASREVVSAIMAPLRLLYSQRDNVSFARTRAMIGQHAPAQGTAAAECLRERLRDFKKGLQEVMAVDPDMGQYQVDEAGEITTIHEPTTHEIFEDWLYGEYLHDDEDRLARIESWRSIGIHEFLFLRTARDLVTVFADFASEIVSPILGEPALRMR